MEKLVEAFSQDVESSGVAKKFADLRRFRRPERNKSDIEKDIETKQRKFCLPQWVREMCVSECENGRNSVWTVCVRERNVERERGQTRVEINSDWSQNKKIFSQKNNLISTLKLKDSSKKPFHFSSRLSFLQMWIFLWRSFVYIKLKLVMKKWANTD